MEDFTYTFSTGDDNSYKVEVKVSPEKFTEALDATFGRMAKDVKVSGFRPGKAPRNVIESKLGGKLFEETLQTLLPNVAADIVDKEQFSPVTNLQYDVQKMSDGDGVEFTFSFTNYPEVKLADPKKVTVEKLDASVTQEEIDEVIQRMFHKHEHKPGEKHDHDHDHEKVEVTDEMVKELEIADVASLKDLEKRIEGQIKNMKEQEGEQELVNRIIDAMIKESKIDLPEALIEQEVHALIHDYQHRVADLGVDIKSFMDAQGMTEEKLHEQKTEEAKQKLSAELLLNEVAKKYEVVPSSEDIEAELDGITDPDIREQYDNARGRRHVLAVLLQRNAITKLRELVQVKEASKPKKEDKKAK